MGAKISSQKISKSLNRFLKVGVYEVKHTGKQNGGYITALTLSLTACGGTSGTTSGNASKETVQSSTTPAGLENTVPESDPSPESSEQLTSNNPALTSLISQEKNIINIIGG